MTDFMQYAYVFLWGILAVLMFAAGRRQGPAAYLLSLFFVFMTVWYALRSFGGYEMFDGTLGIIFKCIIIAFLLLFVGAYFLLKRKNQSDNSGADDKDNE
ncbi:MAG: hypothetical protein LUF33_04230 [Clostridiales bacterium]|nr:hypothetical protein [Clostridiales bacterium]